MVIFLSKLWQNFPENLFDKNLQENYKINRKVYKKSHKFSDTS